MTRRSLSILITVLWFITALARVGGAAVCSNPGQDGPANLTGILNTYYPGNGVASAGSMSVTVGSRDTRGAAAPVSVGDLVLVMQMQDADINSTNTSSYGGSAPGTGYSSLNNAGVYEYVVISSVAGSTFSLTSPLQNTYRTASATGTAGQRSFQVIRVPQYSSATLIGTVTAPPWNGSTGGVVAVDTGGNLAWGGQIIDVTGRGFRGGAGQSHGGSAGYANTDYRTAYYTAAAPVEPNGSKGEGVAGTPRYVFAPTTDGPAINAGGAETDTGSDYPNGSNGRGAPGNAGGGGTDGNPTTNDQNTGGGGGGAYSMGGSGGYGWIGETPPVNYARTGGYGGYPVPMGPGLLTLGGGGGAGSMNNGTGTPAGGLASSGAAGGGIVIIRARTITGTGTITANGTNANNSITNDASGGGGAGGAILVFASNNSGSLGALTVNARGGNGGSNTGGGTPHGPGGGGSGGFVALTTAVGVTINVQAGVNGTTASSATTPPEYGASASSGGYQIYTLQPVDIPGAGSNALCSPLLTVTKSTVKAETVGGGTTTYLLTVTNASGYGTATGVVLSDTLPGAPSPFTLLSTDSIAMTGGATRPGTSNPVVGATAPAWGSFSIPGGGSVSIRFTVAVPVATTLGTYQNPGTVTYDDPTRSAPGQTVSPGGTYAGGGTVPGNNYASASSNLEDVTVWAASTLSKSFAPASIVPGGTSVLSIVLSNPNSVPLNNAAFTDSYPAGLVNTATPSGTITGTGCFGTITAASGGSSVSLTGGFVPAGGACTVSVNVTFAVAGNYTNTIPAGAVTNSRNITTITSTSATLNQAAIQPPSVTKSFAPALIQQGGISTLTLTINNGGLTGLTGIAFTDTLSNMLVATPSVTGNGCGGILTATAGSGSITLSGGSLAAGATCTVSVQVTSNTLSGAAGHANTVTGVTSTQSGAGPNSNTASLIVAGVPTIAKAFSPATIAPGATSTLTFTLSNPGNIPLTNATFSDSMGNLKIVATAPAGGTCAGAGSNTLNAGISSIVLTGLTIPGGPGSCTVMVQVTSTVPGVQTNIAGGISSTETPIPGPPSAPANLNVLYPPHIAKSFFPGVIQSGGTSTITFTLTNLNAGTALNSVAFSDTLANMQVSAAGAAGGTCTGAGGTTLAAGQTGLLNFTGISIPASSSCTVTIVVTSSTQSPAGGHANTVNGPTSTETGLIVPGAPDTAYLSVLLSPTISKAFNPNSIDASTGVTTMTLTLTNPNAVQLTGGSFSDTFPANLTTVNTAQSYIGAGRGTCTGVIPSGLAAGTYAPSVTFGGIVIPTNGSCTIMVDMRSATAGVYSNTTTGVTTFQTPTAGAVSNTATLSVGRIGITKAFSPASIAAGGTSDITFTMNNQSGASRTFRFRDLLPTGMVVATPIPVATNCGGTIVYNRADNLAGLQAGDTGIRINGITLADNATCTITMRVSVASAGTYSNFASDLVYTGYTSPVYPAPYSNVATLTAYARPTIAKAFSPGGIDVLTTTNMVFTLSNPNASALSNAAFSDEIAPNLTVVTPIVPGGTCAGVTTSWNTATNLQVNVPTLPGGPGSCTITIPVTSSVAGTYNNTASGIVTSQTGAAAGSSSNNATLTVSRLPLLVSKTPSVTTAIPGTVVTYDIGYSNPNAVTSLQNIVITDPIPLYTAYQSASCGPLPSGITSCTVLFSPPPAGTGNGQVTWTLGGSLAAGYSGTVRIAVVIQ